MYNYSDKEIHSMKRYLSKELLLEVLPPWLEQFVIVNMNYVNVFPDMAVVFYTYLFGVLWFWWSVEYESQKEFKVAFYLFVLIEKYGESVVKKLSCVKLEYLVVVIFSASYSLGAFYQPKAIIVEPIFFYFFEKKFRPLRFLALKLWPLLFQLHKPHNEFFKNCGTFE